MAGLSSMGGRKNALADVMASSGTALTVTELAERIGLAPSSAYGAMKALERDGRAEKAGVALNGGQTWRLTPAEDRERQASGR